MAGSVSLNFTTNTTETALRDTAGAVTGPVTLAADDKTGAFVGSGSVGFGGQAGFGTAVAYGTILNTIRSDIENVAATGPAFGYTGPLSVTATADGLIVSDAGSAGAGLADKGNGLSGTVSINLIDNTIDAHVLGSNLLNSTPNNSAVDQIAASDLTGEFALAGALGIGKNSGFGAALGLNFLTNGVRAYVENSALDTADGFAAAAVENALSIVIAVGGAGSQNISAAGSLAFNRLANTVDSHVSSYSGSDKTILPIGSGVQAVGPISIAATDSVAGTEIAGGVALDLKTKTGAALAAGRRGRVDSGHHRRHRR